MLRLVLAVLIAGLGTLPAASENLFFYRQNNWSIVNVDGACVASSRSFAETNMSPVAAVRFVMNAETKDVVLETYFWPGAFEEGQATTLLLVKRSDAEVVVPATATTDYAVKADRPFSRAELNVLKGEHLIGVKSSDVKWPIGVEAAGFGQAYSFLLECARTLQAN